MASPVQYDYRPLGASPLSSDSDPGEEAAFLSEKPSREPRVSRVRDLRFILGSAVNAVFFATACILFGLWYRGTHMSPNAALRRTHSYSPLYDAIDLDMRVKTINGTLYPSRNEPSIARQMPNPDADAIWEEWELTRYVPVTADQIRAMGKDPSTAAKLEDEVWGLGDDAYATILDVYHQLHCLNTLRQLAYPEYYDKNADSKHSHHKKKDMFATHINHCVDILMQGIQCSGNLNLITMHWVETHGYPFPDMSINKQCVDFDKLTEWRKENSVDMDKYVEKMKMKEGVNALPAPDEFYKNFFPDAVNPNHINGANPGKDFNL